MDGFTETLIEMSFFIDNISNIFLICFNQLQMEASPEPSTELLPRLCHLIKGEMGYGFNLHSNKAKGGQFVRSVDPHSPAERADVRPGDRLLEVHTRTHRRIYRIFYSSGFSFLN